MNMRMRAIGDTSFCFGISGFVPFRRFDVGEIVDIPKEFCELPKVRMHFIAEDSQELARSSQKSDADEKPKGRGRPKRVGE